MTALKRLLNASRDILRHVNLGHDQARLAIRKEFAAAIDEALREVNAQTGVKVQAVINNSWDMGWAVKEYDALIALACVLEFPDRKIAAIRAFRDRTADSAETAYSSSGIRLKRAKEIIEVAQKVLEYGV